MRSAMARSAVLLAMVVAGNVDAGEPTTGPAPLQRNHRTHAPGRNPGAPSDRRPVVLAVSDSLTNDQATNWLAVLGGMRRDIRTVAEAHGGWTTKSYFKKKFDGVAWAALPERADVAIILIGSNNLFEDRGGSDASVKEAVDGVEKIEAHLRARYPRVQVVLAAPPTCVPERWTDRTSDRRIDVHSPKYLGKLSEAYRRLAGRRGWEFVDLFPLLEGPADFVDAAHPTAEANRRIAAEIRQAVDKLLPPAKEDSAR
jgi:lysophospholipase L1-like esterase